MRCVNVERSDSESQIYLRSMTEAESKRKPQREVAIGLFLWQLRGSRCKAISRLTHASLRRPLGNNTGFFNTLFKSKIGDSPPLRMLA